MAADRNAEVARLGAELEAERQLVTALQTQEAQIAEVAAALKAQVRRAAPDRGGWLGGWWHHTLHRQGVWQSK